MTALSHALLVAPHDVKTSVHIAVLFCFFLFVNLLPADCLRHAFLSALLFNFNFLFCYFHCSGLRYGFLATLAVATGVLHMTEDGWFAQG